MAIPLHSSAHLSIPLAARIAVGDMVPALSPDVGSPPAVALPASGDGVGLRILVVEDDESVRELSSRFLQRVGYRVDTASDGEAGWEALRREVFHLLITDNCKPRLSGLELIVRLRAAGMALPVILVSANLPWHEQEAPRALHPVATLEKPFSVGELLERAHAFLRDMSVPLCSVPEAVIHG